MQSRQIPQTGFNTRREVKPGYRKPRTKAERLFWGANRPDYRVWAVKADLTLEEASALAMGLDPRCIDDIPHQEGPTPARFRATRAWFEEIRQEFRQTPGCLLGVAVFAMDFYLRVEDRLNEAAEYFSQGLDDPHKRVAEQTLKLHHMEKIIEQQQHEIMQLTATNSSAGNLKEKVSVSAMNRGVAGARGSELGYVVNLPKRKSPPRRENVGRPKKWDKPSAENLRRDFMSAARNKTRLSATQIVERMKVEHTNYADIPNATILRWLPADGISVKEIKRLIKADNPSK